MTVMNDNIEVWCVCKKQPKIWYFDAVLMSTRKSQGIQPESSLGEPSRHRRPAVEPPPSSSLKARRRDQLSTRKSQGIQPESSLGEPSRHQRPAAELTAPFSGETRRQGAKIVKKTPNDTRRPITMPNKSRPFLNRPAFLYRKPAWCLNAATPTVHVEPAPATEQTVVTEDDENNGVELEPATEQTMITETVERSDVEVEPAPEQAIITPQPYSQIKATPCRLVTAADLMPIPHSSTRLLRPTARSKRQSDGALGLVLTSSPYLKRLRDREIEKNAKTAKNMAKRALVLTQDGPASKKQKTSSTRKQKNNAECLAESSGSANDPENPACLYCSELFSSSRAREIWVKCDECNRWAHMECAGLNRKARNFSCDFCHK
jgi:hypothetical protein